MAIGSPHYTDGVIVTPAQMVSRGTAPVRNLIDLRDKFGARFFIRMSRQDNVALTNGVDVKVRALWRYGTSGSVHPAAVWSGLGLSETGSMRGTTINADSPAGGNTITVASAVNFAAGDQIAIFNASNPSDGFTEWKQISSISGTTITLDTPLEFTHTLAAAHKVGWATCWGPVYVEGGSVYEIIFDYADDAAGNAVLVEAVCQTYDYDVVS